MNTGDSLQTSSTSTSDKNIHSSAANSNSSTNGAVKSPSDTNVKFTADTPQTIIKSTDKGNSHDLLKLSSKPPHSPTPASPRPTNRLQNPVLPTRNTIQNNGSNNRSSPTIPTDRNTSNLNLKLSDTQTSQQNLPLDDLPPLSRSKRSNTISVMSPTRKRRYFSFNYFYT